MKYKLIVLKIIATAVFLKMTGSLVSVDAWVPQISGPAAQSEDCIPTCQIFQNWCKNNGTCRQKPSNCHWYCECPANCEGYFCEKIITEDKHVQTEIVETIPLEKVAVGENSNGGIAFDKSKLRAALANIYMKRKLPVADVKGQTSSVVEVGAESDVRTTTETSWPCPPEVLRKMSKSSEAPSTPSEAGLTSPVTPLTSTEAKSTSTEEPSTSTVTRSTPSDQGIESTVIVNVESTSEKQVPNAKVPDVETDTHSEPILDKTKDIASAETTPVSSPSTSTPSTPASDSKTTITTTTVGTETSSTESAQPSSTTATATLSTPSSTLSIQTESTTPSISTEFQSSSQETTTPFQTTVVPTTSGGEGSFALPAEPTPGAPNLPGEGHGSAPSPSDTEQSAGHGDAASQPHKVPTIAAADKTESAPEGPVKEGGGKDTEPSSTTPPKQLVSLGAILSGQVEKQKVVESDSDRSKSTTKVTTETPTTATGSTQVSTTVDKTLQPEAKEAASQPNNIASDTSGVTDKPTTLMSESPTVTPESGTTVTTTTTSITTNTQTTQPSTTMFTDSSSTEKTHPTTTVSASVAEAQMNVLDNNAGENSGDKANKVPAKKQ